MRWLMSEALGSFVLRKRTTFRLRLTPISRRQIWMLARIFIVAWPRSFGALSACIGNYRHKQPFEIRRGWICKINGTAMVATSLKWGILFVVVSDGQVGLMTSLGQLPLSF